VPNPTSGEITLQYKSAIEGDAVIRIMDEQGKNIKTYNTKKENNYLEYKCNLSGLTKGIYILSVEVGSQHDNIKVIIN
jgi:hypothetical protein